MFFKNIDLVLFLPAVLLSVLGSITLSSVAPKAYPLQFLYLFLSLIVYFVFARIDIRITKTLGPFFYFLSLFLLGTTFLFGGLSRGAVRWIDLGPLTLQTSEAVKPLLLVFFAWVLSRGKSLNRFILSIIALFPPAFLIFVQPDLGSVVVIIAGFLGVFYMSGLSRSFMKVGAIGSIIGVPLVWNFLADYQKQRIFSFLNPENSVLSSGYNSIQAKIAVGSGEFFGRGLGQGTQSQLLFLPERHTDFIFASISEELGFIGALLIVLCFAIILIRLVWILKESNDVFAQSLIGGIFCMLFVQSAINIGMNLGVLPITGIPLPFVSSGGSALLAMSGNLGIASSVSSDLRTSRSWSII